MATGKKTAKEKQIKYEDKSAGQPELIFIFDQLKKLLLKYVKGSITITGEKPGMMSLFCDKEIEIAGRKRHDIFFAGLMVQKGYVGFYFFPVYTNPELKAELQPELLKTLKGKSCFHIKKEDAVLFEQINDALKKGFDLYKTKGWI